MILCRVIHPHRKLTSGHKRNEQQDSQNNPVIVDNVDLVISGTSL